VRNAYLPNHWNPFFGNAGVPVWHPPAEARPFESSYALQWKPFGPFLNVSFASGVPFSWRSFKSHGVACGCAPRGNCEREDDHNPLLNVRLGERSRSRAALLKSSI
jgi:hypothetical protein